MQVIDLENQSLVGLVVVLDAIVTEMLAFYLKGLSADQRSSAIARITAQVNANGKQIVDMAPQAQLANAQKIQAAAARLSSSAINDALAEIGKT